MSLKKGQKRGTFLTKLEKRQKELKNRIKDNEKLSPSEAADLIRDKIYSAVDSGKMKRPKERCPVCFKIHYARVPDECWKLGLLSGDEILFEFERYITENKLGKIVG